MTVKMFNGRVVSRDRSMDQSAFFVGATSIADVVRLVQAAGEYEISAREVNVYWSGPQPSRPQGCWGNAMDGVALERGVWLQESWGPVRRLVGADGQKIT